MSERYFPEELYANGLTDLISVTPPGAQLTPKSSIPASAIGKAPGLRKPSGLYAGYKWLAHDPTAEEVRRWCLEGSNVGLRAARFPAVDIDCTDPALAQIIEEFTLAKLGNAPVRFGRQPKRLLTYRTDEPFSRMRLWINRSDSQHLVEVLGQGQQYVVHGTHPATLQPYTWNWRTGDIRAIQHITREQVEAYLTELQQMLEMMSAGVCKREGDGRPITRTAGDQEALRAPSVEAVREAVELIPNTEELFPARTDYLRMGYAIRAAVGPEHEDDGYDIFAAWAEQWEGSEAEVIRADWRRMTGPSSVGWNWIAEQARGFGFDDAALDFGVTQSAPDAAESLAPIYSDQWLADHCARELKSVLRFIPESGKYLVWADGTWQPDAELLAEDRIKRELRKIADRVLRVAGASAKEQKDAQTEARGICSAGRASAVSQFLRSERSIAVGLSALDHDPWLLNTPGGVVDLRTGELGPSDSDALCTKRTAVAPDFTTPATRWLQFLQEATGGDQALVDYLRRLAGYCLTGVTYEQHLSFIYGKGGNGKGTYLNAVADIMADYATTSPMDTFTASAGDRHTTELAMLHGARLVTASETEAGKRWNESRLKSLTGGDKITARFMRQDNFTFFPQFKLLFIGNHKPEVRHVDDALRRRIQMVPFIIKPKVVDNRLAEKLRAEWPSILAWMIAGCLEWQRDGLTPPSAVQKETAKYFKGEDTIGRWIEERCEESADAVTPVASLYQSYREWANENGEYVLSLKRLSAALEGRAGLEKTREADTRRAAYRGLAIQPRNGAEIML